MNKKIFLSWILWATLLLSSCSSKPLWTFEEEIKAEQASYVANIDKSLSITENFLEWKFESKNNFDLGISAKDTLDIKLKWKIDWKSIVEKDNIASEFDLDMNLNSDFKNSKFFDGKPELNTLKWANLSWNLKFRWWYDKENVYFNLKEFNFDWKWTEDFSKALEALKAQYNAVVKPYTGRWYFVDLAKTLSAASGIDFSAEFQKWFTQNKRFLALIWDSLKQIVSWDIFSKAEKTTFEGKEAYKFSIDDEKLKKHLLASYKTISEKYSDLLFWEWFSKEEFEQAYKNLEEGLKNEKIVESSELYLYRWSDNTANIVAKSIKFSWSDAILSFSILEKELKLNILSKEVNFESKFEADKSGKISFSGNLKNVSNQKNILNFSGHSLDKISSDKNKVDSDFNILFDFYIDKTEVNAPESAPENIKVNLNVKAEVEKKDSLNITKETITENAKEIISTEELLNTILNNPFLWGGHAFVNQAADLPEEAPFDVDEIKNIR